MTRFLSIVILFWMIPFWSKSQIQLELSQRSKDQKFDKSMLAAPIWRLKGSFINIEKEVVGQKSITENLSVQLPDMTGCLDSAYTLLDFNGVQGKYPQSLIAVVIGDAYLRKPMRIWVDHNKNLNFNDDGEPIVVQPGYKNIYITLKNETDTGANIVYRLSNFDYSNNARLRAMQREYYEKTFPERLLMWADIGFRTQLYKTKTIDYQWEKDSFTLGVLDGNLNGLYNDLEEDYIVIGEYNSGYVSSEEINGAVEIKPSDNFIIHNGIQYNITNIDKTGNHLTINYNTSGFYENRLKVGSRFKKFSYKLSDNKSKSNTRKLRWNKNTIVYFFNFDDINKLSHDTAILGQLVRDKNYKVLFLFYGKYPERVKNFAFTSKGKFKVGYTKKEINYAIPIDRFPTIIQLGRWMRVKQVVNQLSDLK